MNDKKQLKELVNHEIDRKFQEELVRVTQNVQIRKQAEVRRALKNFYGNVRKAINELII